MLIPDRQVADVVSRLTGAPADQIGVSCDSVQFLSASFDLLDTTELIMEFEFKETVQWALRYVAALSGRATATEDANSEKGATPDCATHSGIEI